MTLPERRVAAVVVNHNAGEDLLGCVKSLRAAGIVEIVVVDNASSDGSLARVAKADTGVVLVPTGGNLGYGAAVNRGVESCVAPYVLACNPDLIVDPKAPSRLADVLDERRAVAVAGPRILATDGSTYPSARAFPSLGVAIGHAFVGMFRPANRWSQRYRLEGGAAETGNVDWLSGACMCIRRVAFASVGGFDPGYFMYAEDLDLCWRLRRASWEVAYVPETSVIHAQGSSASRHPYRMLVAHHRSTWRFAQRSSTGAERLLLPVVGLGLVLRLVIAIGRELAVSKRGRRRNRRPMVLL